VIKKIKPEIDYIKLKYLIYGQPKSGKSTFVSQFANPDDVLFFPTEEGHKFLEVNQWVVNKNGKEQAPTCWNDFKDCASYILTKPNDFKTIVIDTADNLAEWCMAHISKEEGVQHESDLGFGKGYSMAKRELFRVFNALTMRGYGVIFISHEKTSEINGAKNIKKTYTDTTMSSTAKKLIQGMVDFIFYFYIDENNQRLIRTKGNDYINAGDRSGLLPEIMPMNPLIMAQEIGKATQSDRFKEHMRQKQKEELDLYNKILNEQQQNKKENK
jgi:adenosyl cobinamide kinase/adenosyl cobinamide phosphate guanylyltransferase